MMSSDTYKFILTTLLFALVGFTVAPFFLLVAIATGWISYKSLTHVPTPEFKTWKNATESDDWVTLYHAGCESPAETAFLDALLDEYDLRPDRGVLKSPELVIEMQFECINYRFDFLANGSHIIEIDGAAWHSSPEQVERDRLRDEASRKAGFEVLRIPAKVVFNTPKEAIRRVREALKLSDFPVEQRGKVVEIEKQKSFLQHTNAMFKGIAEGLDEINRHVDQATRKSKALSGFESKLDEERMLIDSCVEIAKNRASIDAKLNAMSDDQRASYLEIWNANNATLNALFDDRESPLIIWPSLPIPGTDNDPEIQKIIDDQVQLLTEKRERHFAELRAAGEADKDFQRHLFEALEEFNCPSNVKDKMVNFWAQAMIAHERRKPTAVSTLEGQPKLTS